MNPQLLIQLMNTAAQLIMLVDQLKSGALTDAQAWDSVSTDFKDAVAKWDSAVTLSKAPVNPVLQTYPPKVAANTTVAPV